MQPIPKMQTKPFDQFEFHDAIRKIAFDVRASKVEYDYIVGLSRGGLIPGVVLSHQLAVPFRAINWSKDYKDFNTHELLDIVERGNKRILIVDDMVDSGQLLNDLFKSFDAYTERGYADLNQFDVAVLINNTDVDVIYSNKTGEIRTKYFGKEISKLADPSWIVYWWERQLKNPND